jgi:exopolysaccharide biosynthesis polyprenyl glycosylphosphotransferase
MRGRATDRASPSRGWWTLFSTGQANRQRRTNGLGSMKERLIVALYMAADLLVLALAGVVSYVLRYHYPTFLSELLGFEPWQPPSLTQAQYLGFWILFAGVTLLTFRNLDLYHTSWDRSYLEESRAVVKGLTFATVLILAFMLLTKAETISRFVVGLTWATSALGLVSWRMLRRWYVLYQLSRGYSYRNVLIVGAGRVGQKLAETLQANSQLGYRLKGFLDDYKQGNGILGTTEDVECVLQRHFIEEVFITIPSEREVVKQVILAARRQGCDVKLVPDFFDGLGAQPQLAYMGELPILDLYRPPIPELGLLLKRSLDIVGALAGLIGGAPLMAAIALAIKLDDGGPIIYKSRRVGRKGRVFNCYKFRTMVPNADELKEQLRALNEREGPFFKLTNDPRLTRVGRVLRKYSLDEWPQFFNVLKGDMSLVGPRPHPLDDFERYELEHYRRLDVKPGMTSLWAVEAQDDPSFERNMELDLYYIEHWSLWLDIKILLKTITTILKGVGR